MGSLRAWFGGKGRKKPGDAGDRREKRDAMMRARHATRFEEAGVEAPQTRYAMSEEVKTEAEIQLLREKGGITYLYNDKFFRAKRSLHINMSPPYLYWFSQTDPSVERIGCDLSDGEWPGFARFTYSTCFAGKVLVPDQHFFRDRGYAEAEQIAAEAPDWDDRGDTIYWRGQNNNVGLFSLDPEHIDKPWVMQRMRLAMKARDIDGVDARFVAGPIQRQVAQCEAAGLIAPSRPWQDWAGDKYAIDIDGFTNAWSNLMQRLKLGCCVLKVESQHGYRQWYYDKLVPFETYVPVKADMSDLAEKVDWVRSHDREAREIAAAGQAFARAMTFETETRAAARIIEDNWA